MHRFLIAVALALVWSGNGARASACSVAKWRYVFGQQTSATMSVNAGASCQTSLNSRTSSAGTVIQSLTIKSPPRNGTAITRELGVAYQSKAGFKGQDSFSFLIMGGGKTATVHVNVTVKTPEGVPLPDSGPIKLLEYAPWLIENRGPEKAVGVFYFIRGLLVDERGDERHRAPQYFLKSLSEAGWDILYARYPHDLAYPGHEDAHKRVAEFIRERIRELKGQGYRRIIVGGQSWGAWVTMVAERNGDLAADGLFLLVPATYGKKTTSTGKPNLSFPKNRSEFATLVKSIRKPAAAVFFANDDFDPGGRGKLFEDHVLRHQLAHVLIDNPPGFSGHFSGWSPVFDYVFGRCLQLFFETLDSQRCDLPPLSDGDFRSIVHRNQISDLDSKRISTPEELIGRSYVVYSADSAVSEVTFTAMQSVVRQRFKRRNEEQYEFKQGQYCRGTRCRILIRWDDKHLVGFDPNTGATATWWVEKVNVTQ